MKISFFMVHIKILNFELIYNNINLPLLVKEINIFEIIYR
jgi:hypothetical protein